MAGGIENLTPWQKGTSGNPGGKPRTKLLTSHIAALLEQEAPKSNGRTWAAVIAEALLKKARKGDVRAITELANRLEGKPVQAVAMDMNASISLAERLQRARKRVSEYRADQPITSESK